MLLPLKMCKSRIYRMGALAVCPFIPISGVSEEECVQVSKNFGARLGQEVSSSVVDFSLAKDFVFPSICWLSFTAVSASLSLRGGVQSKLQVLNLFLHLLMYECVPLSFKEKSHIWKSWKSGIFQENNAPDQSWRVRGSGREGWHQQNSQLKIIFPFLFVYSEQYWYGPPCRPHLILSQLALSWKRKNGHQTLVQPLLFQPGVALSPG